MTIPLPQSEYPAVRLGLSPGVMAYTADQMREYGQACREAALEEAANVCEELNKFSGHSSKRPYPSDCAFAIRSLK